MEVKAKLKYAKVGTQKARLVADLVRGQNVNVALKNLTFMNVLKVVLFRLKRK